MRKKLTGKVRRDSLLAWLKDNQNPLTGTELADKANVSRQVIVQDISLLKAQDHPIIATSNGYIYMKTEENNKDYRRVIACKHARNETKEELYTIVDFGVIVENVVIEHPIYGDLKASLMISSRADVDKFVDKIEEKNAPYLLELTDGVHNHTLVANEEEKLDQAFQALQEKGFIAE
ncbi:transcriptional repressor for NAD biosynthesis [Gracilibacillus boraciitolerans JCM 21714]|uniref:Transcriptional repressor for NAD biosynthesis n=1 Tax=Gracilibacillus boraciitolerans JCM 21714 TaxID=1298598 RepID=W4VIL6_9BACI|nr:transcription repressor NadR [Gracilibacillus boraciitolerans]GAE92599.1 transcriptional repressor for NAD biosynthesis [Gracilibacillus boraciitolerans JCM 21714]